MLYPEPQLYLIVKDRAGLSSNLPTIPKNLSEDEFNDYIEDLSEKYPSDCYEHPRPKFLFPLKNSEDGNPIFYFSIAIKILKEAKFNQEAAELQQFMLSPSENHIQYISRYLDIGNFISYQDYQEQSDFAKKRKINLDITPIVFEDHGEDLKQIPEFRNVTINSIKKLISQGFDFNTVNTYGRNMLWYADSPDTTSYLINNTDIDIFHIDEIGLSVFNKCFLHQDVECSYGTLITLIDNMHQKNPNYSKYFLENSYVFESIVTHFTNVLDKQFLQSSSSDFLNKSEFKENITMILDISSLIYQFNEEQFNLLTTHVGNLSQKLQEPGKNGDMEKLSSITKIYETLLNQSIPTNTHVKSSSPVKF